MRRPSTTCRTASWASALLLLHATAAHAFLPPAHNRFLREAPMFPIHEDPVGALVAHRLLAGGEEGGSGTCSQPGSFLGVGNVECLHSNLGTVIFLLAVIIIVSLLFERGIHAVRRAIECPQLKKIVNRVFEEVMIMGFISMVIFTLNTSGLMEKIHSKIGGHLTNSQRLHFYEFFHYIVFLTMIYFIVIVLFLLFVGTVVPKLIWERQSTENDDSECDEANDVNEAFPFGGPRSFTRSNRGRDDTVLSSTSENRHEYASLPSGSRQLYRPSALRGRADSGMDLVQGSRAYALLLQRYQREGWCFMFNIKKQWQLWKSFEILAYNICQNRSGYIYKNPNEMNRLFGVSPTLHTDSTPKPMSYDQYHVLCMRNLLFNISHLHFSAFFVLLLIAVVPVLFPHYDHWIFLGVGAMLLFVNVVIFLKVLKILRGIVDDRLRVISRSDIRRRMPRPNLNANRTIDGKKKPPSLRVVALGVRAVIRMQMSSLCHHQLHFHNDRFWFNSPRFLLRLFHFATIGQAFYLVWFTLVEWQTVASTSSSYYLIPIMILLPFVAMCVITPMTIPSLVLVMSLTGIFVELNGGDPTSGQRPTQRETKTHIRLLRRSYLKSHYTDTDEPASPMLPSEFDQPMAEGAKSPASVFLRIYDSPKAAAQHAKSVASSSPRRSNALRHTDGPLIMRKSASSTALDQSAGASDDLREQGRTRWSFDLGSVNHDAHRDPSVDLDHQAHTEPAWTSTPPISPAFKNYCSKYGGYPDA